MDQLGLSEDATLANLSFWFSSNVGHGGEPLDSTRAYYVAHTFLQDRLRAEHRDWGFARWTGIFSPSGCHSAANLLHDLARSINIPLLNIQTREPGGVHQGLLYRWQRSGARILHHTDDLYIAMTIAPFFLVRSDGTRASREASVRQFFEVSWPLLEEMTGFGYHHSSNYDLSFAGVMDCPITGVNGGDWSSIADSGSFDMEKRYKLCSWRDFVAEACAGRLSAMHLTRAGARLSRPYEDFHLRANQCASAYGMCDGLNRLKVAWDDASGTDTWVDP